MNKTLLILLLATQLLSTTAHAAEHENIQSSDKSVGFGIGALIGGLFAGPPGAVVGAATGSYFSYREINNEKTISELEKRLQKKNAELNTIINEFAILESEHKKRLHKVRLTENKQLLVNLSEGVSLSIYFRTDQSEVDAKFLPPLKRVTKLIRDIPEIKVQLDAYTDQRGDIVYNQKLSHQRATSVLKHLVRSGLNNNRIDFHAHGETQSKARKGDLEAYGYERRVDLTLSLHTEV